MIRIAPVMSMRELQPRTLRAGGKKVFEVEGEPLQYSREVWNMMTSAFSQKTH